MDYVDILREVNKNEDWEYNEENRLNNILYHLLFCCINYPEGSSKEIKNEFRREHDCDAFYYKKIGFDDNESLFADSMISFWMPYQSRLNTKANAIEFQKPRNKTEVYKIKKFNELINCQRQDINIINDNQILKKFFKLVYTKGNFMLLPNRQMQYRGDWSFICDEIDWTLYHCHKNGSYFKYFDNDEEKVNEWIKREKLELADKPFLSSGTYKQYYDMTDDEFYEYLSKVNELIEYRNEHYHPEEFVK